MKPYSRASVAAVAATASLDLGILRTQLLRRRVYWAAYAIVLAFQLLVNGVLTGRGVVRYRDDVVAGARLARAPVEDLGFGFALVTQTMAWWVWFGRHGLGRTPGARPRDGAGDRR